ncbi:hypothetical protein NC796_15855 [Aliifodinibius sp. S!AR15-10]|uniref:hypothetical protein n=1 Tax=Aliifodinibius sp. S!AR15-10 TaxID=2950437 RepID=UPI00285BEFD5|nr:hypothetical protein [Aliifodinibius sp. S!AR15-10]MDR8392631.1 hypothetical protein [Aliifodinibius sp. S!AR15-10]
MNSINLTIYFSIKKKLWAFLLVMAISLPASAHEVGGSFTLKRLDVETWRAEYCFDVPVKAVRFNRPFEDLRKKAWMINDAHLN